MGLSAGSTRARCKGTALLWHCAFLRLGRGDHGLGGPRTEGLASRLCGSQRQPGGLRPKAARGWAGSEGSDRVKELGRAGPSRAERGHAPTAAIMGWRGPGEGGGEVGEGRASSGYYGMVRPSAAGEGRESRDYYGMARPSATGGGQVGGRSIMGWRALLRRGGGWGEYYGMGVPHEAAATAVGRGGLRVGVEDAAIMGWQGPLQPERVEYYGVAQFPARVPGRLLWDGAVPTASLRNIMGCSGQGEGNVIMGCRRSTGRGGGCSSGRRAWGPTGYPLFSPAPVPSRPTAGPLAPSPAPQQFTAHSAGGVLWDGCSPRAGVRAWGGGCHGAFPVGGYYGMDSPLWTIMGCVRCRRVGLPRRAAGGALHCPARGEPGREPGQPLGAALGHPAFRSALCLFQLGEVRRRRQPFRMIERRAK